MMVPAMTNARLPVFSLRMVVLLVLVSFHALFLRSVSRETVQHSSAAPRAWLYSTRPRMERLHRCIENNQTAVHRSGLFGADNGRTPGLAGVHVNGPSFSSVCAFAIDVFQRFEWY